MSIELIFGVWFAGVLLTFFVAPLLDPSNSLGTGWALVSIAWPVLLPMIFAVAAGMAVRKYAEKKGWVE